MNNSKVISALHVPVGSTPIVIEIDPSEKSLQQFLGGPIEEIFPFFEEVMLLCNANGKAKKLAPNRALYEDDGKYIDIVAGDFLLVGAPFLAEGFASLTEMQLEKYAQKYKTPDEFVRTDKGYQVVSQHTKP